MSIFKISKTKVNMIKKSTLDFLKKLKANNNKDWFDKNRPMYFEVKKEFETLVAKLITQITSFDSAVKNLEPKNCIFRINRDVRFAKDKSPYKTNIGASISPGGKKSMSAGYYVHIEPGNSFLAGGIYMPPAPQLNAIRQEIDYNIPEFKKIISEKEFKKYFGKLDESDKLKTVPKGYPKDHPEVELLKLKSYLVVHELKDEQILSSNFIQQCTKIFKALYPLDKFLRRAVD